MKEMPPPTLSGLHCICKLCGEMNLNLKWREDGDLGSGWKLVDKDGNLHVCSKTKQE